MVHDLTRNTKHCQKCLCSDVGNAVKSGKAFQELNIYVVKWNVWWEVGTVRGKERGDYLLCLQPKNITTLTLFFLVVNSSVLYFRV